jgi:hypothetical protein
MFFRKKLPQSQAELIKQSAKKKLQTIRKRGENAARRDHTYSNVGIIVVACAAILGMSYSSVMSVARGHIDGGIVFQLVTIFVAVLIMNFAQSSAARNIRRLQSRGEEISWRDNLACYGVLAGEALSFGYAIWLIEHPQNLVQWILLVVRSVLFVYTIMYLELQRDYPIDTVDMVIESEIGAGYAMLDELVDRAYDPDIPLALRMQSYKASATLEARMERKLENMVAAAMAQDEFKASGNIVLIDTHGEPLHVPKKTIVEEEVRTTEEKPPKQLRNGVIKLVQHVAPRRGKKSVKKAPAMTQEERIADIVNRLQDGEELSVRKVVELYNISQGAAQKDLLAARERVKPTRLAGPIAISGARPPEPVDTDEEDDDITDDVQVK